MPDSLSRRELTNVAAGGRGLTLARMGLLARLLATENNGPRHG